MSISSIKAAILQLDKAQLRALVMDLAKLNKENKHWLVTRLKLDADTRGILEDYRKKISRALERMPIDLRAARQTVMDFMKISRQPDEILELMVSYGEIGVRIENRYGDLYESFYASMETMFEQAVDLLRKNPELIEVYRPRLFKIVAHSAEGWNHRDTLEDMYERLQ